MSKEASARIHQPRRLLQIGLALAVLLTSAAGAALAAADLKAWIPGQAQAGLAESGILLFHRGSEGTLVGLDRAQLARLSERGAQAVLTRPEETLYVVLLENASAASFEGGARVLWRGRHEVLVATGGRAPVLTEAAAASMRGLVQPVRIGTRPLPWSAPVVEPPSFPREADPIVQDMVDSITEATYVATWQTLDDFENRYAYHAQNNVATQWILEEFQSYGLSAEYHYFNDGGQRRNVIATLPGVVDPSRVVYITGHLDATSGTPNSCAPGADDNGSGTAAVLEAARVLSQYRFQYTVKFAAFNNEEQGLVGSAAYCNTIAGQGENVIAVFNADMISYRGTDPAPADLIIYTNNNSQPIATILEQAADTYVANLIDPVVVVEALEASDHASFWAHGWRAVCAIEEEAWGSDFCPWYHTCDDRIERYPTDYPTHCTKALVAATAIAALPIAPDGPYLVLGGTTIDDDGNGGSQGNGDGTLNPGETIELLVNMRNVGTQTATNVHGVLASADPNVTILTANADWPNIPVGGNADNLTAFRFQVSGSASDGANIQFSLTVTDNSGQRQIPLQFPVAAPRLVYYWHQLDDAIYGNGSGAIDPGEVVRLGVTLSNLGGQAAADVTATLTSSNPHVVIVSAQGQCPLIPVGGQSVLSPAFEVAVSAEAAAGEVLQLQLAISAGAGYQAASGFPIKVGTRVYTELEEDGPFSLTAPGDDADTGLWVRVDPNGTTYNNQPCQPEDDHTAAPGTDCFVTGQGSVGGAAGEADLDGGHTTIVSPVMDLATLTNARLTYWRWYTNNLGNNPNQDTWLVQVSSNGGTSWVDLERTTSSGNSWQQMSFRLADHITVTDQVVVKWVADDSGSNSLVEAAVDDIEISGDLVVVGLENETARPVFALEQVRPNPIRGETRFAFSVPARAASTLQLFSVDGRLVRTLLDRVVEAGRHQITWDGRDQDGRSVAPGVYFYKLESEQRSASERLVIIR